jgi:hypothetical protein
MRTLSIACSGAAACSNEFTAVLEQANADRERPSAVARVNRASSFLFSSAQPRHRLDANAKKERLD